MVSPCCRRQQVYCGRHVLANRQVIMLECSKWSICKFPETGGIVIAPRPAPDSTTPKPGFPTRAFFGIDPVLVDSNVSLSFNLNFGTKFMAGIFTHRC